MMRTEETAADGSGMDESSRRTILLVDDQKDERTIQKVLLEHLGYTVVEASDGEMALEIARRITPDLVLLDIAMPKLDGLEVCKALRADPRTSSVAVLFYTAAAGDNEQMARSAGGDGVLVKPVEPNDVAHAIARLIGTGVG
jgi:CheY-like chemotaxis protein